MFPGTQSRAFVLCPFVLLKSWQPAGATFLESQAHVIQSLTRYKTLFYRNLERGLWVLQWGREGRITEQVPRTRKQAEAEGCLATDCNSWQCLREAGCEQIPALAVVGGHRGERQACRVSTMLSIQMDSGKSSQSFQCF